MFACSMTQLFHVRQSCGGQFQKMRVVRSRVQFANRFQHWGSSCKKCEKYKPKKIKCKSGTSCCASVEMRVLGRPAFSTDATSLRVVWVEKFPGHYSIGAVSAADLLTAIAHFPTTPQSRLHQCRHSLGISPPIPPAMELHRCKKVPGPKPPRAADPK